jgi:hypothetical protein
MEKEPFALNLGLREPVGVEEHHCSINQNEHSVGDGYLPAIKIKKDMKHR